MLHAARCGSAARDVASLYADNAAAMAAVSSTSVVSSVVALGAPPSVVPALKAAAQPENDVGGGLDVASAALDEREVGVLKADNARLRAELDESHARAGKIAELQRRQSDIHCTLLRAAHDEALAARDEARKEAAETRASLTRANEQCDALTAQLERHKATSHAEACLLAEEALAAREELTGTRAGERTQSAAGVHVATLRAELASADKVLAMALDAVSARATWQYTAPHFESKSGGGDKSAKKTGGGRREGASLADLGGLRELTELKHWSNGDQPQQQPKAQTASPGGPTLSTNAMARLERLEGVAVAAAERFETLHREHEQLRVRYELLLQSRAEPPPMRAEPLHVSRVEARPTTSRGEPPAAPTEPSPSRGEPSSSSAADPPTPVPQQLAASPQLRTPPLSQSNRRMRPRQMGRRRGDA